MRAKGILTAAASLILAANSSASGFTPADFNGPIRCGTTFYKWSDAPDVPPVEVATGVVELTSNGHGKWTKGILREEIVGPQNSAGAVCTYNFSDGDYVLKADGSGLSNTSWRPAEGNDPRCASFNPESFGKAGVAPALMTAKPGTASVNFYLTSPNTGYQMAVGPSGYACGTCAKPAP